MERRQWPRYQVDWAVQVSGMSPAGAPFSEVGTLRNISARGMLVNLSTSLSVNQTLSACVQLPQGGPLSMEFVGKVLRVESTTGSFAQMAAVHLLATGCKWGGVASILDIDPRILGKWARQPLFSSELKQAREHLLEMAK